VLFTFPSRYLFTIGRQLVFSLTRWSAQIHTRLHLYRVTQEFPRRGQVFGYGPFTLFGAIFHSLHLTITLPYRAPTTPGASPRFGLFRFRSPLLTESLSLSFPPLTEMFHFSGCGATRTIDSCECNGGLLHRVTPFGHRRVIAYLPLSVAYRSLSRPSSPAGTKASIMCPL
jgi:hypothetical protein